MQAANREARSKKEFSQAEKALRNILKEVWGKEIYEFLTKIGGIPEKICTTNEKLRQVANNINVRA